MTCASSSKARDYGGKTRRRSNASARGVRRYLARAQGLGQGVTDAELVFELHVRRGLPLPEVAQVLGLSLKAVREYCPLKEAKPEARAPQGEADVTALRERVGTALWETVAATFAEGRLDAEGKEAGVAAPPMLSVRIRALKQIAKLYGVGRENRARASRVRECVTPVCATPEEIVELVREWRGR